MNNNDVRLEDIEDDGIRANFYITYDVVDADTNEYFFCGGQNVEAHDSDHAERTVKAMFGKHGKVIIKSVEVF